MKYTKRFFVFFSFFLLIPCLVFAYHALFKDSGSSFVVEMRFDLPVDFRVDSGGDDEILEDACDEWNDIEDIEDLCGQLTLSSDDIDENNYDSLVSGTDGINDFVFDENGLILEELGFSSNVLGVSLNTFVVSTGEIIESTVILNTSISPGPSFDPLSTTVHELGHAWGLAHIPIGAINNSFSFPAGLDPIDVSAVPTMFPTSIPTNDAFGRTLEPDDLASIFYLYRN